MGLFKKRQPPAAEPAAQPDPALTFFTAEAADHFRRLAAAAFADLGQTVRIHPDHAIDAEGRQFGFWNIGALCATLPREDWADALEAHLRSVLEGMDAPSPFEELDRAEAHFRTYARLYEEAGVPRLDAYPHQSFAPGLVEIMALDLPDAVAMFRREEVERFGGFAELRASGITNLTQLPVEELETVAGPNGSSFRALFGESVYTASRALLLPQLATDLTGERPTEHGWLMSVPNRHQLVWHVVEDATVIGAIHAMARFAALGYSDSPGPLSPHVYWWNGTEYEQLTRPTEDGSITIEVSPRFQAVLESVAG